jgi:phage terminase small subunit
MTLKFEKQERFAQELAKGGATSAAYLEAGYKKNPREAYRVARLPQVLRRVEEIRAQAALRSEASVAGFTLRLMEIADEAQKKDSASALAVARGCLMDAAKLNGLGAAKGAKASPTLEDLLEHLGREEADD